MEEQPFLLNHWANSPVYLLIKVVPSALFIVPLVSCPSSSEPQDAIPLRVHQIFVGSLVPKSKCPIRINLRK